MVGESCHGSNLSTETRRSWSHKGRQRWHAATSPLSSPNKTPAVFPCVSPKFSPIHHSFSNPSSKTLSHRAFGRFRQTLRVAFPSLLPLHYFRKDCSEGETLAIDFLLVSEFPVVGTAPIGVYSTTLGPRSGKPCFFKRLAKAYLRN